MRNFKKDVERAAKGEKILKIAIAEDLFTDELPLMEKKDFGKALDWEYASKFLDFEYDTGFGSSECPPIIAWTENNILVVSEYDGATSVKTLPRNPVNIEIDYM